MQIWRRFWLRLMADDRCAVYIALCMSMTVISTWIAIRTRLPILHCTHDTIVLALSGKFGTVSATVV
jgi:hypothetical protein